MKSSWMDFVVIFHFYFEFLFFFFIFFSYVSLCWLLGWLDGCLNIHESQAKAEGYLCACVCMYVCMDINAE